MTIHHTLVKKAQKAGIVLMYNEDGDAPSTKRYKAHWTKKNVVIYGGEAKFLLNDMLTVQLMDKDYPSFDWDIMDDDTCSITVKGTDIEVNGFRAEAAFTKAKAMWVEARSDLDVEDEDADNETQEEIDAEIEEEKTGGSVVASKYRARYAERGNPTNCGDWLAETLVNLCTNKEGINIELFEAICLVNGVDLSGYRHDGHGWQGRLRMTGRNLMAKVVYFGDGTLKLPEQLGDALQAPQEWMDAQKFKAPKVKDPDAPKREVPANFRKAAKKDAA
jgi:hypothetical protein